ncbi:hypothetical protein [Hahella sp. NBU794]|uniref:hypothetical protein n=1 Tax=Hahella sp. NBU794 TaxID=3422590 RepID=UPI003D6E2E60
MFTSRLLACSALALSVGACAHTPSDTKIESATNNALKAQFDLIQTRVYREGPYAVFEHSVRDGAGALKPNAIGQLAGSDVFSYVWPTSLNSSAVGFAADQGILAFVLTAHPDFDDTPKFDENADGKFDNDGDLWHSHWVVLTPDEQCGPGALKVKDIPAGAHPDLPATWPGLPLFIDSPGYEPELKGEQVRARVPLKDMGFPEAFQYDGVTAALRVNVNVHSPLLCVTNVWDVASGDLSLPATYAPK